MRQTHFFILMILASNSLLTITATAQVANDDKDLNPPEIQSKSNPLTEIVKRRLENVKYKPKRPTCMSGPTNQPFPDEVEQIFTDNKISVLALPDTYSCDAIIDNMMICDIDNNSLFFIRAGATDLKMSLIGSGELKVRFGGRSGYECR